MNLRWMLVSLFVALVAAGGLAASAREDNRPTLGLRATPVVAFSPAEILFVGELKGGDDDYEEFYCASIEWDWDDDTRSTTIEDCEPYQAGESEIRRRFSMRHKFDRSGEYEVRLHLKNKDKIVTTARTRVEVRGGLPRF